MNGIDFLIDTNISIYVLAFSDAIKDATIALKQQYVLKLPDSIIAATAKQYGLPLITADKNFKKLDNYINIILLDV